MDSVHIGCSATAKAVECMCIVVLCVVVSSEYCYCQLACSVTNVFAHVM